MFYSTNTRPQTVDGLHRPVPALAGAIGLLAWISACSVTALLSFVVSVSALAAVPVEEAGSGSRSATSGTSGVRLSELYYQLQTLQQEVRELRGIAEEQAHTIARLRKDQKSQYLELDKRMQSVMRGGRAAVPAATNNTNSASGASGAPAGASGGAPASGSSASPTLRNGELYVPTGGSAPAAVAGSGAADEQERSAYSGAIDLMKAREFDDSIRAFNKLVVDFPGGGYNGHAFYWLGELYLAKGNESKAKQQFVQVIDLYPGHNKVPDALYKLGVVHHRQGDNGRALELFNRVRAEHGGSSAAKLAADYAKEMQ